jgi:hypothetical protein
VRRKAGSTSATQHAASPTLGTSARPRQRTQTSRHCAGGSSRRSGLASAAELLAMPRGGPRVGEASTGQAPEASFHRDQTYEHSDSRQIGNAIIAAMVCVLVRRPIPLRNDENHVCADSERPPHVPAGPFGFRFLQLADRHWTFGGVSRSSLGRVNSSRWWGSPSTAALMPPTVPGHTRGWRLP